MLYLPEYVEGEFSEVGLPLYGVLRSSLGADLLLYDRLGRLRRGYGIRVPVHHLLGAIFFRSKDHRDPQSERGNLLPSADLGLRPLYLHHVGKLRSYMFLDNLDANELAISDLLCSPIRGLISPIRPMRDTAIGVSQGYIVSTGPQLLQRLGVSFE